MSALPREVIKDLRVIAFDADDTLWDCQSHFEAVENHLYQLIAPYCEVPAQELLTSAMRHPVRVRVC